VPTYYRDDRVHVTSTAIHIDNARYVWDEIGDLWVTQRSLAARRILIGFGILAAAILVRVAASYVWFLGGLDRAVERWLSGGPATVAVVAVVGLAIAVVGVLLVEAALSAIEDIRGYGRNLELWASIDGHPVRLYHTNNAQRFGQIRRAIVRARG
jgi:hypothetical protein